jgi:hypothetical protein
MREYGSIRRLGRGRSALARDIDPRPVNVETRRLLIVRFENEHRSVT